jgi:hypothetical protein
VNTNEAWRESVRDLQPLDFESPDGGIRAAEDLDLKFIGDYNQNVDVSKSDPRITMCPFDSAALFEPSFESNMSTRGPFYRRSFKNDVHLKYAEKLAKRLHTTVPDNQKFNRYISPILCGGVSSVDFGNDKPSGILMSELPFSRLSVNLGENEGLERVTLTDDDFKPSTLVMCTMNEHLAIMKLQRVMSDSGYSGVSKTHDGKSLMFKVMSSGDLFALGSNVMTCNLECVAQYNGAKQAAHVNNFGDNYRTLFTAVPPDIIRVGNRRAPDECHLPNVDELVRFSKRYILSDHGNEAIVDVEALDGTLPPRKYGRRGVDRAMKKRASHLLNHLEKRPCEVDFGRGFDDFADRYEAADFIDMFSPPLPLKPTTYVSSPHLICLSVQKMVTVEFDEVVQLIHDIQHMNEDCIIEQPTLSDVVHKSLARRVDYPSMCFKDADVSNGEDVIGPSDVDDSDEVSPEETSEDSVIAKEDNLVTT